MPSGIFTPVPDASKHSANLRIFRRTTISQFRKLLREH
jgi:hypothetical protein